MKHLIKYKGINLVMLYHLNGKAILLDSINEHIEVGTANHPRRIGLLRR
ncbi:MAG: hypothetical protein VXY91_01970 [Bacteroidota bacterium]|nr:hypothetical protein [Bacteroidota bacterium]